MEPVVVKGVSKAAMLAIDYRAGNLYWTDTGSNRIEVIRINAGKEQSANKLGKIRYKLIKSKCFKVLNSEPVFRKMFKFFLVIILVQFYIKQVIIK